eukprot:2080605-Pleurochrysis_carterae.AAC.1
MAAAWASVHSLVLVAAFQRSVETRAHPRALVVSSCAASASRAAQSGHALAFVRVARASQGRRMDLGWGVGGGSRGSCECTGSEHRGRGERKEKGGSDRGGGARGSDRGGGAR